MSIRFFTCTMLLIIMLACCDDLQQNTYRLRVVSGDQQHAIQGDRLANPILVEVTDHLGNVQQGVQLSTAMLESNGIVESISPVSNEEGIVTIQWRVGKSYFQKMLVRTIADPSVEVELSAISHYRYFTPPKVQDGWEIGSLDVLTEESQQLLFDGIDELRAGEYPETHSVVLVHNKQLILEEYYVGKNLDGDVIEWDRSSPHTLQSASKSFRSLLIGIAIDKGFIASVDVPFYDFFPEHSDLMDEENKGDMTLEHVLTMSSGLDWEEWAYPLDHPLHNLSAMYALPKSEWVSYVLGLSMRDEPGAKFVYNTGTSLMLDDVISNSLANDNMTLKAFSAQYYFDLVEEPGSDYPNITKMTPRQMAKFGYVFQYDGKWKDNQVVSSNWIEESTRVRFSLSQSVNADYGYQWWMKEFKTAKETYNCFYAAGNGGQFIIINKTLDLIVVLTGGNFNDGKMYDIYNWVEGRVFPAFE